VALNREIYSIVDQTPIDCNENGVPDECQAAPVPALGGAGAAGLILLLVAGGAGFLRLRGVRGPARVTPVIERVPP